MTAAIHPKVEAIATADDGEIPNNPRYPLLYYKSAVASPNEEIDAGTILGRFAANGWGGGWIDGIYDFHHYHARAHEVLANAGDPVTVQFGGRQGPVVTFSPGDVVIIPAGVGHCRLDDPKRLVIVGAYPPGQESWDLKRIGAADYARGKLEVPLVARPRRDPVTGQAGPLLDYWSTEPRS